MPKIHKPDVPLRPIVSFCTSPTYSLSKRLVKILSPLASCSFSAVRNSKEFFSFIQTQQLEEDEVLVSFDVISLFTKVATALALEVVQQHLTSDGTLQECTSLTVDYSMSLLSLCLDATYFTFRNVTYQQIYGTAMGSPVSVVVTNLVKLAIFSFVRKPRFWNRYVDDVCCSVQECDVNDLVHLNSIEPSI